MEILAISQKTHDMYISIHSRASCFCWSSVRCSYSLIWKGTHLSLWGSRFVFWNALPRKSKKVCRLPRQDWVKTQIWGRKHSAALKLSMSRVCCVIHRWEKLGTIRSLSQGSYQGGGQKPPGPALLCGGRRWSNKLLKKGSCVDWRTTAAQEVIY